MIHNDKYRKLIYLQKINWSEVWKNLNLKVIFNLYISFVTFRSYYYRCSTRYPKKMHIDLSFFYGKQHSIRISG